MDAKATVDKMWEHKEVRFDILVTWVLILPFYLFDPFYFEMKLVLVLKALIAWNCAYLNLQDSSTKFGNIS